MNNLLVAVLGNRHSGKSYTWNQLFGRTVRTGSTIRKLYFNGTEYVEVFLISGSPQEREKYVGELITVRNPRIVLCSIQYIEDAKNTIKFFTENNYFLFIHWLNPGFSDSDMLDDDLDIIDYVVFQEPDSLFGLRNGKVSAGARVQEIKDFIYGWAKSRGLVFTC